MKYTLFFILLLVTFWGNSQEDIKIERRVKRFENAIRDVHRLGFNKDFTKSDALDYVIISKDSLAQNCPISLQNEVISIDQDKLLTWINTYDSEFQQFIAFLEAYIRKNI